MMLLKIRLNEDFEKVAGILAKNGYAVRRVKVKGKKKTTDPGIEITGAGEVEEMEEDE
jgi:hypothetical protein